jgi:hypothetical protein
MRSVLAVVLAGCGATAPSSAPASEPIKRTALQLTNRGLGPITKSTRVTLSSLRTVLAPHGLTVRPEFDSSLSFDVYKGTTKLFYVVGNDDGSMLYVHTLTEEHAPALHPSWIPGHAFYDDDMLSYCDCWGQTTVCWTNGEHVAVGFSRSCDGLDSAHGRKALQRERIARVVWSPTPFQRDDRGSENELFGVPLPEP